MELKSARNGREHVWKSVRQERHGKKESKKDKKESKRKRNIPRTG